MCCNTGERRLVHPSEPRSRGRAIKSRYYWGITQTNLSRDTETNEFCSGNYAFRSKIQNQIRGNSVEFGYWLKLRMLRTILWLCMDLTIITAWIRLRKLSEPIASDRNQKTRLICLWFGFESAAYWSDYGIWTKSHAPTTSALMYFRSR